MSPFKAREDKRRYDHERYIANRDGFRERSQQCYRRRRERTEEALGGKCFVCGSKEKLVFHHLKYGDESGWTEMDLKKGYLVLLCRKHHRAVNFINNLRWKGELDVVLSLLNATPHPRTVLQNILS